MSKMVASPDLNIDSNWYLDSGATNYLTHGLINLSTRSEYGGGNQIYGGGNQIYVVNGLGLPRLHSGSLLFKS